MTIAKDAGVQAPSVKRVAFTFADFVSGTALAVIDLPSDAEVIGGNLVIDTAFNSATSDTITVGDKESDSRYKSGINGQTAASTDLVPTGVITNNANRRQVVVKWTGVSTAPSAGAGHLNVVYLQTSRADFIQR